MLATLIQHTGGLTERERRALLRKRPNVTSWRQLLETAKSEHELRENNARFLGPAGELTQLMKRMRDVPGDKRRELGQSANAVKSEIGTFLEVFPNGTIWSNSINATSHENINQTPA